MMSSSVNWGVASSSWNHDAWEIIAANSTYHYSGSLIPSNEEKLFVAESATKSRIRALLGATVFSRFVSIYCKFA